LFIKEFDEISLRRDLSRNQLSGSVPYYFETLSLRYMALFDNNMSGQLAKTKNGAVVSWPDAMSILSVK
jgi:hypothetical protein